MLGFTLIEAMIIVSIVGILSSFGISAYQNYAYRARATEAFAKASTIKLLVADNALNKAESLSSGFDPLSHNNDLFTYAVDPGSGIITITAIGRGGYDSSDENAAKEAVDNLHLTAIEMRSLVMRTAKNARVRINRDLANSIRVTANKFRSDAELGVADTDQLDAIIQQAVGYVTEISKSHTTHHSFEDSSQAIRAANNTADYIFDYKEATNTTKSGGNNVTPSDAAGRTIIFEPSCARSIDGDYEPLDMDRGCQSAVVWSCGVSGSEVSSSSEGVALRTDAGIGTMPSKYVPNICR